MSSYNVPKTKALSITYFLHDLKGKNSITLSLRWGVAKQFRPIFLSLRLKFKAVTKKKKKIQWIFLNTVTGHSWVFTAKHFILKKKLGSSNPWSLQLRSCKSVEWRLSQLRNKLQRPARALPGHDSCNGRRPTSRSKNDDYTIEMAQCSRFQCATLIIICVGPRPGWWVDRYHM